MTRKGDWIQTYSCKQFWVLDPRPEDVAIEDIAHALSMMCRFTGHTKRFYSVAEHCMHVSVQCNPADALWGLLHDASEAYLVDLARPVKNLPEFKPYRDTEAIVMRAVCDRFGLMYSEPPSVREADYRMCFTEARDLMSPVHPEWNWHVPPYDDYRVQCWSPDEAKDRFMARFYTLAPAGRAA